jgi:Na+-transporting NADH:ubiquinone oxidoreductase subunit NqrC
MRPIIQWLTVPALVCGAAPAYAVTYLTLEQAQTAIFPGKKLTPSDVELSREQRKMIEKVSGVRVRNPELKVWRVEGSGWFILDEVIGKHEFITYAVGLTQDGAVKQIEVMDYRETYGGQVRDEKWRAQFTGKKHGAKLKLDDDIQNISGATLSSRHIADGVRRLLATYEFALKNGDAPLPSAARHVC